MNLLKKIICFITKHDYRFSIYHLKKAIWQERHIFPEKITVEKCARCGNISILHYRGKIL